MEIRSVSASDGVTWLSEGFKIFRMNPLIWIVITVIFVAIVILLSLVPIVGSIATMLLEPVLIGGMLLGCRDLELGQELRIEHLFDGFRQSTEVLIRIGLYSGLAYIVIGLIIFAMIGAGAFSLGMLTGQPGEQLAVVGMLIGVLIAATLSVPIVMATWFAPALVIFQKVTALDAMRLSFKACLRNVWPFLTYGLVALFFAVLATLPAGLGLFLFFPSVVGSIYVGYQDIFKSSF